MTLFDAPPSQGFQHLPLARAQLGGAMNRIQRLLVMTVRRRGARGVDCSQQNLILVRLLQKIEGAGFIVRTAVWISPCSVIRMIGSGNPMA
jgi:hypothetical protein